MSETEKLIEEVKKQIEIIKQEIKVKENILNNLVKQLNDINE